MSDLITEIDLRFQSGNSVPVSSARLDAHEWCAIKAALLAAQEMDDELSRVPPGAWAGVSPAQRRFRDAMGGEG